MVIKALAISKETEPLSDPLTPFRGSLDQHEVGGDEVKFLGGASHHFTADLGPHRADQACAGDGVAKHLVLGAMNPRDIDD